MTGLNKDYSNYFPTLGSENAGLGLCMILSTNDYYKCRYALGKKNINFGECILKGFKGEIKLYYGYLYNGYGIDQLRYNRDKVIFFIVQ